MRVAEEISKYKTEQEKELQNILSYWMQYAIDEHDGGFHGRIDNDNKIIPLAAKGSVLNSRILWSFSAAYRLTKNDGYLKIAERAFAYLINYFIDNEHGGVYWSVDHKGQALNTKKQFYALAFALYGISEYYLASGVEEAKKVSIEMYETIEKYSHDKINKGYIEALTIDWQQLEDNRLSDKDSNERKSMNTHLHMLEAYTNLYRVYPQQELKANIIGILELFEKDIIDPVTNHLILFFDDEWNRKSETISFGHDIEAAWLLLEAAEVIEEPALIERFKKMAVQLAQAAAEGFDRDGGLWYEYEDKHLVAEKHWWVQAEAMVGFLTVWQITREEKYLEYSLKNWQFVRENILHSKGEWIWGIREDGTLMSEQDKVGIWKCPYHNSRACMEIIQKLNGKNNVVRNRVHYS